ncbi:hypothetical protein B0J11DRAFT_620113 [Dendryphion nanum]|uniref:Apple domain-containing protein n=1 Tax=Dendryphion nanum TaxID=256645 RepID=A0A9P9I7D7_9PLEO|nr:hypothetical protein B0J11DRAFT_620113 [Dendryphion nanum]
MGVRSFLFAVLLLALIVNVFYLTSPRNSPKVKRTVKPKAQVPSRNPSGGPINGYSVIRSYLPRSETDEELLYDPSSCGLPDGEIRTIHGRQLQIECGVLHTDGDYKNIQTDNALACIETCALDTKCIALAFKSMNGASPNCFLKESLPPPRLLKGARHPNVIGAKVVGGSLEPPICTKSPVAVLKPPAELSSGTKCGRRINMGSSIWPNEQARSPTFGGTLDECFQNWVAGNYRWVGFRLADSICTFYNTDPSIVPNNNPEVQGFDAQWYQFTDDCFKTIDPCDTTITIPAPATLPPPYPPILSDPCTFAPAKLKSDDDLDGSGAMCGLPVAAPSADQSVKIEKWGVTLKACYTLLFKERASFFVYDESWAACKLYSEGTTEPVYSPTQTGYTLYQKMCFDFTVVRFDCEWPVFEPAPQAG